MNVCKREGRNSLVGSEKEKFGTKVDGITSDRTEYTGNIDSQRTYLEHTLRPSGATGRLAHRWPRNLVQ